jgi:hypothetical protein
VKKNQGRFWHVGSDHSIVSPLGTVATSGLFYKPQLLDEGDCGAIGGMQLHLSCSRHGYSIHAKKPVHTECPYNFPSSKTRRRKYYCNSCRSEMWASYATSAMTASLQWLQSTASKQSVRARWRDRKRIMSIHARDLGILCFNLDEQKLQQMLVLSINFRCSVPQFH